MNNQEKLNTAIRLSQSYILLLLKGNIDSEQLSNIEKLFESCPVVMEKVDVKTNEFGKTTNVGGMAENHRIVISFDDIDKININNEIELNKLLSTIIHEYAHKIRAINNEYGEMFEESFATIFAELCINNARLKLNDVQDNKELFETLDSVNYQKYESQVRALLYVLKQNGLDIKMIIEYIAGNQEQFKQVCSQILGNEFNSYFDSISSKQNEKSEQILIDIIVKYIKEKGLNISDYWNKDGSKLSQDNLYFRGSSTLCKSVINVGIENFTPDEQQFYKYYESSVKVASENDSFIRKEKIDRIRQFIESNFSLKEKSLEEIYDTIIDLCSTYIQYQNKDDEESRIFIGEIVKIIPDIENFKIKFINLRVTGQDKRIFEDLNVDNITYDDIISNLNRLSETENKESGFTK